MKYTELTGLAGRNSTLPAKASSPDWGFSVIKSCGTGGFSRNAVKLRNFSTCGSPNLQIWTWPAKSEDLALPLNLMALRL